MQFGITPVRQTRFAAALLAAAALMPAVRAHAQPARPLPSVCDATSGNLVRNCGFEAGDLTDWAFTTPPFSHLAIDDLATSAHTGRHMLRFTGFAPGSVASSFVTVPGARYTFTFFLVSLGVGGEPASSGRFEAYFGGRRVFDLLGQGPLFDAGYARYSFTETAADALTTVRFDGQNAAAAYNLDDVMVMPAADAPTVTTPEPATLALVGGGLLAASALAAVARRRRG